MSGRFKGESTTAMEASRQLTIFLSAFESFLIGGGGAGTGLINFTKRLPLWLNQIGTQANPIFNALPDFGDTLRYINSVVEAVNRIFSTEAMKAVAEMNEEGITRISNSVTAMISNINEFSSALRGVEGIDINAELHALNDRLGLGKSGTLTINAQPVTLNINFDVKIDAEELEKVLVERPGHTIATIGGNE